MKYEMSLENLKIMHSEDYKDYLQALCWVSEEFVPRIRVQFAEKAFEMFADETVRKIVLACGEEYKKLKATRLRDFVSVSEHGAFSEYSLTDDCLNHFKDYAATVYMLFEIH